MNGFIQSFSGRAVTPLHLMPEQVTFEDIPHALAQKTRFNGHLKEFFSVAQHCCLGAEYIEPIGGDLNKRLNPRLKLAFLLHEAGEIFLPDVPAPIKPFLSVRVPATGVNSAVFGLVDGIVSWSELEDQHANAIFRALLLEDLLPLLDSPEVKQMDRSMLATEKRDLRSHQETDPRIIEQELTRYKGDPVPGLTITRCWGPHEAEARFTAMYQNLRSQLG